MEGRNPQEHGKKNTPRGPRGLFSSLCFRGLPAAAPSLTLTLTRAREVVASWQREWWGRWESNSRQFNWFQRFSNGFADRYR